MTSPFFAMRNKHTDHCGQPPLYCNDAPGRYHGYFENAHGEQWVFVYDRESKKAELRGGDCGWSDVFEVHDGRADGIILGHDEAIWLQACWRAAVG